MGLWPWRSKDGSWRKLVALTIYVTASVQTCLWFLSHVLMWSMSMIIFTADNCSQASKFCFCTNVPIPDTFSKTKLCIFFMDLTSETVNKPPVKCFLLQIALIMVAFHSNVKVTKKLSLKYLFYPQIHLSFGKDCYNLKVHKILFLLLH